MEGEKEGNRRGKGREGKRGGKQREETVEG